MLWVDTTHGNIDKYVDRYFMPMLKPIANRMHYDRKRKILTYPTGSYIDFGSAERPELLEGFGYKRAVLNEAGIILRKAKLWDNTIYPMIKDTDAIVKITGTPKGRNLYHQLFLRGKSAEHPNWQSYQFTVYDSPYYTIQEINAIRETVPEHVWLQEYMAKFLEGAGTVFRNIRACVAGMLLAKPSNPNERYIMAVDLAKYQDFTVIMVMNEQNQVVYFDRFNNIDWTVQKARIMNAYKTWNAPVTMIDSTGLGDAIYDDLRSKGMRLVPFKFSAQSKNDIIRNLIIALENKAITFPDIPELIDELEIFEYEVRSSGLFGYSAPEGFHDDCVVTLAMLYELAANTPTGTARDIEIEDMNKELYAGMGEEFADGFDDDIIEVDDI